MDLAVARRAGHGSEKQGGPSTGSGRTGTMWKRPSSTVIPALSRDPPSSFERRKAGCRVKSGMTTVGMAGSDHFLPFEAILSLPDSGRTSHVL